MNTTPPPDTLTTLPPGDSGDGGGTALRMERSFPHPPTAVWAALTEPAGLAQWFPSEVTLEPRPGGAMTFRFPGPGPGAGETPMDGTVTAFDEPRRFAFTWGDERLDWALAPDGAGTSLTLTHTFADRAGAASFASGWHLCLTALGQLLDGKPVRVGRDTGELHEAYVKRFDLDRGSAERLPDGGRVRVERQLVRPAETVWELLAAGIEPVAGLPVPEGFTAEKVPAGPVTEVRAPRSLTYTWQPHGTVTWELAEGTGHGARLILTQTGPEDFDTAAALAAWQTRIEQVAARLVTA